MKKLLSFAVALALVAMMATPALACGSHSAKTRSVRTAVCTVEDCCEAGLHSHDGSTYAAHYYGDGHDYHEYCDDALCTLAGYHEHDGTYCFGHTKNDGHSYHRAGRRHH